MAGSSYETATSKRPKFPALSYNFGDPYRAEMTRREETLKKSRRPGLTLPPDAFCPQIIDMTALNNSLLMSEAEMNMLQEIFIPKEMPKPSYPYSPSDFKDDYDDIDATFKVDLTPEKEEAQKAIVFKPEPWTEIICEEQYPSNLLYENSSKDNISNQPFDDPIKESTELLEPSISTDFLGRHKPRTLGLRNIKAANKEVTFPDPLPYEYLLALHQFEDEEPDVQVLSSSESDESSEEQVDSITLATERLSVDAERDTSALKMVFDEGEGKNSVESDIKRLTVTLTGHATDVYHLLRVFIISTWETLTSVPDSPLSRWAKQYDSPLQLNPSVTAQWVNSVKEKFLEEKMSRGSRGTHPYLNAGELMTINIETGEAAYHLANLQAYLLCLHGAVVTFDTFVNLDFEVACNQAIGFHKKLGPSLPSEFNELLHSLSRLELEEKMLHPKVTMLVEHLLNFLETSEIHGIIWICLHRYSTELASSIYEHLGEAGIDCTVDPVIFRPKRDKPFKVRPTAPIIIAEVMPKDFPASKISLILHYEPPPDSWKRANRLYNSVAQEALTTCLPSDETDHVETGDPQSSSLRSTSSSGSSTLPLPSEKGTPCIDRHNTDVIAHEEASAAPKEAETNDNLGSPFSRPEGATANPFAMTQTGHSCSIIVASHLKQNSNFMDALNSLNNINLCILDYKFLKDAAKYQPDILLSSETALLIYQPEAGDDFSELRMKLQSTSLKCTKCWVIIFCPDCRRTGKLPRDWHSLNSLAHYHSCRHLKSEIDLRFQVIPSLAFNYGHVAAIVKDVTINGTDSDVTLPIGHEAQRLLSVPHLNVISAQLVARIVSADQFFSLTLNDLLKKLLHNVPENICLRIIAFHESTKKNRAQQICNTQREPNASFGKITKNLESYASPRFGSGVAQLKPGQTAPESIEKLREMWTSHDQTTQ